MLFWLAAGFAGGLLLVLAGRRISMLVDPLWKLPFHTDTEPPGVREAILPGVAFSYQVERSLLIWPTPFEWNFMTGQCSSWRRHVYYRLRWNGGELVWRYEQWYYRGLGWSSPTMTNGASTGLIRDRRY